MMYYQMYLLRMMLMKDILVFFEEKKCDEYNKEDYAYTVKETASFKILNH